MPGFQENRAILTKCLALVDKTISATAQIDDLAFPTQRSVVAQQILLESLEALKRPETAEVVDPEVFYNKMLRLQDLVQELQRSTSKHISWPLVSFCDKIWGAFFSDENPIVFYTTTQKHNYEITSFSGRLSNILVDLLTQSEVEKILADRRINCLYLPSLENENLPLYANITHEFGHAIFLENREKLVDLERAAFADILKSTQERWKGNDGGKRAKRVARLLHSAAEELFADLLAARIVGPSFLLSLYEISWGDDKGAWKFKLAPTLDAVQAYPSFDLRLELLKSTVQLSQMTKQSKVWFEKLATKELHDLGWLEEAMGKPGRVSFQVSPLTDPDRSELEAFWLENLEQIRKGLELFLKTANELLTKRYSEHFIPIEWKEVGQLIERLENDILPNIIPDGSLLGKPARFQQVLMAAALYRMALLTSEGIEQKSAQAKILKIERLAAKAFEVAYIQQEYNAEKETNWASSTAQK